MSQEMHNVLKRTFVFLSFWGIVFSQFVFLRTGDLRKKMYDIFTNLIQTLTSKIEDSIQKHLGPGGGVPVGVWEARPPTKTEDLGVGIDPQF